ncbi:MAG: hypothetical protein JWN14_4727 [Chthonomonadales bacterium]|nr:hypothetical protein [Chthonomonadales bacterium]
MQPTEQPDNTINPSSASEPTTVPEATRPPFGANEMRLNARQWLAALVLALIMIALLPPLWKRIERFDTGPDYRIPYALSNDYWLYQRRLEGIEAASIPVLGDSVVWGEYVRPEGTLTHFLNQEAGQPGKFVNCGVNGLFPLSLEGLVESYAGSLHHRKVILHCNVLWISSPKADLSIQEEETFNHVPLVPQFSPRIPCYRADTTTRLTITTERSLGFFGWVNHLDNVYFDQQSIPNWTLAQDSSDPPQSPNAWRNPLAQITLRVPGEPKDDPQRGPSSPRHKPWNASRATPTHFDWVPLQESLQWHAFQHTVELLRSRGNDVLVILGPFNESMVAEEQRPTLHHLEEGITTWLTTHNVAHLVPQTLPSALYADASHPLTDGYAQLASDIYQNPDFKYWLQAH